MPHPVRELATATILFTDVVNSTATRTALGEEPADRVFARHSRVLRDVVRAHRTIFVKSVGDGVMAVFPSSTEGLRAAAAIQRAVAAENLRAGTALGVRCGLSSGDIIWTDDDVDGLPAIEASRLTSAARGGQALCSELTARLAFGREGLEFKEIGNLELKGLARPLLTLEVLWWHQPTNPTATPAWLDADDLLPLVGREQQVAALSQWLATTVVRPTLAVVEGEPGAGKTRLLSELAAIAVSRGRSMLAGRCTDPPTGPLQPFAEAITRLATDAAAMLVGVPDMRGELTELARLAPVLTRAPFNLHPELSDDPESEYFRLVAAIAALIERLGSVSPVVFVLEDVHWATPSTLRMLQGLLARLETTPVHVIATVRRERAMRHIAQQPALAELLAYSDVTRIYVPPLAVDDIATALIFGNRDESVVIPIADSARIAAISGGNAFLVTETIRELRAGRAVGDADPPETIRRFVASRVQRIGPVAREAVELIACAARIELGALRVALAVDDRAFVGAVDEALGTGLVDESEDGVLAMSHDLARASVRSVITPAQAALLHRRLVDAMTAVDPDIATSRPYLLAAHRVAVAWLGATDDVRAARDAARSAADHASSRLAHQEAVTWLERSIHFHDRLRDGDSAVRVELVLALGRAKWRSGDHDARSVLNEAGRAAEAIDRPDLLIEAALAGGRGFFSATAAADERAIELLTAALDVVDPGDLATRAELLAELAAELTWAADGERRFALSDEALELARRSGDERALTRVLAARALTINAADTLDQRLADSEELIAIAGHTDDELLRFHAAFQATTPLLEIGATTRIAELLGEAQRLSRVLGQPELRWLVEFSTAGFELMRGDVDAAETRSAEALQLGIVAGRRTEAMAFFGEQLAEIRRLQGRLAELEAPLSATKDRLRLDLVHAVLRYLCEAGADGLEDLLERAIARGLPPRRDVAQRAALDNLIFVASRFGRRDLLPVLYDALLPSAATFGHSAVAHPCGHHYLGLAAHALGDLADAERHFEAAWHIHEPAGVPLLLAESLIEWLRLVVQRGDGALCQQLRQRVTAALSTAASPLLEERLREVVG